jgi:hypothetical protein
MCVTIAGAVQVRLIPEGERLLSQDFSKSICDWFERRISCDLDACLGVQAVHGSSECHRANNVALDASQLIR